jgi:hypothetical protein
MTQTSKLAQVNMSVGWWVGMVLSKVILLKC